MRASVSQQNPRLLYRHVWTPDPAQWGFQLRRSVSDTDWRDMLGLMVTYHAIHEAADLADLELWLPREGGDQQLRPFRKERT